MATWAASQQLYRAPAPPPSNPPRRPNPPDPARRFGIPAPLESVNNQTIQMTVRTSIGGNRVRVRLESALGSGAVVFGSAAIGGKPLTFSGRPEATLYAGATLVSDPVDLKIAPLSHVDVTLYVPGEAKLPTNHLFALHTTRITRAGDPEAMTRESYYWLAGIDVLAPETAGTVVTFGDSITDGDQSTPGTDGMWPAILATRLQANKASAQIAVVNAGISGNRILGDNGGGLARLYHDALSQPGVRWLTLLEGINDITGGVTDPRQLIAAYRQVIAAAHLYGVKVIGCTLTPFGDSRVFTEEREKVRAAVNDWIRTGGAFDGVIDFDKATRDSTDPLKYRREADSPDGLHPANPGYKLMGDSIDLKLFTR
ncbi:MAG: SGNH/GDSL hydrolase family protein [Acidobacteriota bacterium]|nr:SGNH/GDSL hydrolase family protein [Acidobacteriota bacterium]